MVAFEVFEYLRDPNKACEEIHRVLKPGGVFLMTIPFMFRIHADPSDYSRFTKYGLTKLVDGFAEVDLSPCGGADVRDLRSHHDSEQGACSSPFSESCVPSYAQKWLLLRAFGLCCVCSEIASFVMAKKILFVINSLDFFISHRMVLAEGAREANYQVAVFYGTGKIEDQMRLEEQGYLVGQFDLQRSGVNLFFEVKSFLSLYRMVSEYRPDLIHMITIKPILYGGVIARLLKIPAAVSAVSGLGFLSKFNRSLRARVIRTLLYPLFFLAFHHRNQRLIFQNLVDRDVLKDLLNLEDGRITLIPGSGIDLTTTALRAEPEGSLVVSMASRLLHDKGVNEFFQAAQRIKEKGIDARFWLIGEPDPGNPKSVTHEELQEMNSEGAVELLGFRSNVPELYAQSHIVTLPSYYGEGLPKSLIEAAAIGRAIVTTDMPGCRDAVVDGETGLLVQPKDVDDLVAALTKLLADEGIRKDMGRNGRKLAEQKFDIRFVVDTHLNIYSQLLDQ